MLIIIILLINMARPKKHRRITCNPNSFYFKPAGIPLTQLEEVILEGDELEALRLGDLLNLSQEEAAARMKISRATFGRTVNKARAKIADCILNGKAIKISDEISEELKDRFVFICKKCGLHLTLKHRRQIRKCPKCESGKSFE